MTQERRKDPRVKCDFPASLRAGKREEIFEGRTVDLSRGGSLIRSPIPLEAGSGLELRIDLGEFRLAPVEGCVRRSHPAFNGTGHFIAIEFDERSDDLMDALGDAMEH